MRIEVEFSELLGKTLKSITVNNDEKIIFECTDGTTYEMFHEQECCESVEIYDICGGLNTLIGRPLVMADEVTDSGDSGGESYTWTFYNLATIKGYVTIRWYGTSNGYYSESVSLVQTEATK